MNNIVINCSLEMLNALKIEYKDFIRIKDNPHYFFFAQKDGLTIEAYKTGKVVIKGLKAIQEENFINQKFINYLELKDEIGSDEVGTGDVFGPIVVCAFLIKAKDRHYYEKLGIKDSKQLTDEKIVQIAKAIEHNSTYEVLILNNPKFNEVTRSGLNMNEVKAKLHNHVLLKITKRNRARVILDQFCFKEKYFEYLRNEKNVYENIHFETKAESKYLAVAAASIMARYIFLSEMQKLSKIVGYPLQKGASVLVDHQLKRIIQEKGFPFLDNIAKVNFQNIKKIKEV